jgi:AcrR family transcriptional regulator
MIAATKQEARENILRGVQTLLARFGYRKMTMDDLAAEVGIGKGTIYLYFPSKEELVLAHIDAIVDHVCASLSETARSTRPTEHKLHTMLVDRVMLRFDAVHPYRNKVGENLAELRPLLYERRKLHFEREARILSACLVEGRKAGELHFKSAPQTAMDMILATNALLPPNLTADELEDRERVRKTISGIATLVLHGVTAKP